MGNPRPKSNVILDWIAVSYRTVALVGIAIVAAAAIGVLLWLRSSAGPQNDARDAIARATLRYEEASTYPSQPRLDEVRGNARSALQESRSLFQDRRWDDARVSAIRSENYSQQAIDMARGAATATKEVRFYRIEGDVRVKRSGAFSWDPAHNKMTLRVGDQVKTGTNASAELIYFDGTITTLQPGSLLEIREVSEDPGTKVRRVSERLNWGEILASTQKKNVEGSFHEIATESVAARSEESGRIRIAYDKDSQAGSFDAFEGRFQIVAPDRRESLVSGERIRTSPSGELLPKEILPAPPRLVSPSDQRVLIYPDPASATTTLSWEKTPGADRYFLVISDRSLFANKLWEGERKETNVEIAGIAPGEYYWKVAATAANGIRGPFSDARRFRVTSRKITDTQDTQPPPLELTEAVQTGPMLILNGRTEPGALLWVDNEKVDVSVDGTFYAVVRLKKEGVNDVMIMAQDAAGNTRKLNQRAFLDPY